MNQDLTALGGTTQDFSQVAPLIFDSIKSNLKQSGFEYPDMFEEFVRAQGQHYPSSRALVLPPGVTVDGSVSLDLDVPSVRENKLSALVCFGDLTVTGDILNRNLNRGLLLFVGGNLRSSSLVKGGGYFLVTGDLVVQTLVITEYNDGVLRVGGNLSAPLFINLDQDVLVAGDTNAHMISQDEDLLSDVFVPDVFDEGEPELPSVDKIIERQRSGLAVLN
jgi:hypothetical protein